MSRARFTRLSAAALAFTLLVILWGAYVRITGSGAGCGNHWPTCGGEVVPHSPSAATLIEYTHRLTSGLALLSVVAQALLAPRVFPRGHFTRRVAYLSLFFMVTEALVGAGLVLFEKVAHDKSLARGWWMGAHLINTFLLVGCMTLTAWSARLPDVAPRFRGIGRLSPAIGGGLLLLVVTGVTGAIAALGDTLFPARSLAEGFAADLSPQAHLFVQLRGLHPFVAAGTALALLGLASALVRREATRPLAQALGGLVVTQIVLGTINLLLRAPPLLQILHLLLADGVWMCAVLLAARAHLSASADAVRDAAPADANADAPASNLVKAGR